MKIPNILYSGTAAANTSSDDAVTASSIKATMSKLMESLAQMPDIEPKRPSIPPELLPLSSSFLNHRLHGLSVIPSPLVPAAEPKLSLSPLVEVTPEFREQFNARLIKRFGYKEGMVVYKTPFGITMHPDVLRRLEAICTNDSIV